MCVQIPYLWYHIYMAKEKRIELRVSQEAKTTIEEAAKLANVSVSSYILSTVLKQAKVDLSKSYIVLNDDDRDALLKALQNPEKPNQTLINLLKR